MPLGVVRVEQALRRDLVDDLRQLPAQIHRILHTGVQALAAVDTVDVCGVAREKDTTIAVLGDKR